MRVHLYGAGTSGAVTHPDLPGQTVLKEIVAVEVDEAVYQVGDETEVELDVTIEELFGTEPGHVIVHHCRNITATVDYTGKDAPVEVHPATTVRAVTEKGIEALRALGLVISSTADLVLRLPGSTEELPAGNPIGMYVPNGTCSLTLDLVHLKRPQG